MERIVELDNKLRQSNEYELVMNKYAKYFCIAAYMIFMFFSISMPNNMMIWFCVALMLKTIVDMHMNPYLYLYKDKKRFQIYHSLRETGISKEAFIKLRQRYYYSFISKIYIASVGISILGGIIANEITVKNTLICLGFITISVILVTLYAVDIINSMTKE